MFYYVDESGHTGINIFDPHQPILSYGLLSSKLNIDVLAEHDFAVLRKKLGTDRLHASQLGTKGLLVIADSLIALQKKYHVRFDLYSIQKPDHAVISFFDQVFDQGINPAITWTGYWTPLRYVLLLKLASLFDEAIAKKAWKARTDTNNFRAEKILNEVCLELLTRVDHLPDARSRQLISDALTWAAAHPNEIHFNTKSKSDILQISPNLIGFQSVMHGIANRTEKSGKEACKIVVDQQLEYNNAQTVLATFYAKARGIKAERGPGMPTTKHAGMPKIPLTFSSSKKSAGLEFVDIHLWIFKRIINKDFVPPELIPLYESQLHRGRTDEVSLNAISKRWENWFAKLPEPTERQIKEAAALLSIDENRRLSAMTDLN